MEKFERGDLFYDDEYLLYDGGPNEGKRVIGIVGWVGNSQMFVTMIGAMGERNHSYRLIELVSRVDIIEGLNEI